MTISDRQGHALTGATATSAAHYEDAVTAFNLYRGDPIAALDAAIAESPDFTMAHILKAAIFAAATEPEAAAEAQRILINLQGFAMSDREAGHVAPLRAILRNEWTEAAVLYDRHSMRHPLDLPALQVGHLYDFYRANARDMRDRIARALPAWSEETPGYSFLLGMRSFGLEESGDYARAEEAGRAAIDLEPRDAWAHHAVAHVMEMQGRAQDGIGWMAAREPYWSGDDNFFKVHNWWHKALFHLDLDQTVEVFRLYDEQVRADKGSVVLDLLDASALLWRLQLVGQDVGDRWVELAAAWDSQSDGKLYPFNDWHAAMAYMNAGRDADVARLLAPLESRRNEVDHWIAEIGQPLIRGFQAFHRKDYVQAVELLHPTRYIANRFGGSHAQRDIIDWTLTEAALRGGLADTAAALAHERLAVKPHSPINRDFLERSRSVGVAAVVDSAKVA